MRSHGVGELGLGGILYPVGGVGKAWIPVHTGCVVGANRHGGGGWEWVIRAGGFMRGCLGGWVSRLGAFAGTRAENPRTAFGTTRYQT